VHGDFSHLILKQTNLISCCCWQLRYPALRAVDSQPQIISQTTPKTTPSADLLFFWYSLASICKFSKTFRYVSRNVCQTSMPLFLAPFRIKILCKICITVTVKGTVSPADHSCKCIYYFFSLLNNQPDAKNIQIYSVIKLYIIYIKNQRDATWQYFISNCNNALHVSDAFCVHPQEHSKSVGNM